MTKEELIAMINGSKINESRKADVEQYISQMYDDAKRYRWLRADNAYACEELGVRGGDDLDTMVDEEMEKDKAAGKRW